MFFFYFDKIIIFLFVIFTSCSFSATLMNFNGRLIDSPCKIDQSSLNQTVVFLNSTPKNFWQSSGKKNSKEFHIKLNQCNSSSLWKSVKIKFNGETESAMGSEQKNYLSLLKGSNKGKLAIGIIDLDSKKPIVFGENYQGGKGTMLTDGSISLKFEAYIQATPIAISKKNVDTGTYNAVAEFEVIYE